MSTPSRPLVQPHAQGQRVGYARVSTAEQKLDRQLNALNGANLHRVFSEHASGATTAARPQLQKLLAFVRAGDTVVVTSPDRLARNAKELLDLADKLTGRGIGLEFLSSPELSTTSSTGRLVLTVLAAVAEMERNLIRERQAEGIAAAKARGVYGAPKLTQEQIKAAKQRLADGVPKTVVARDLHVDRKTLTRAVNGEGAY